jgi:hypothetical protein
MLDTIPEGITWRNNYGWPIENVYIPPQLHNINDHEALSLSKFFNPEINNPQQSTNAYSRKIIGHLRARPPTTINIRTKLNTRRRSIRNNINKSPAKENKKEIVNTENEVERNKKRKKQEAALAHLKWLKEKYSKRGAMSKSSGRK